MLRASTWLFLLCVSVSSLSACTTTQVQTFSAPSLAATQIESIAILPFQPTRFGPHIALSLNRSIEQAFAARNQRMRIVGPAEAQAILGAANLVEVYAQFVRDYRTSGLLNKGALHQVHDALNVDAILSGSITSVVQLDGAPHRPAFTHLTLTYALIGLRNGGTSLGYCGNCQYGANRIRQSAGRRGGHPPGPRNHHCQSSDTAIKEAERKLQL